MLPAEDQQRLALIGLLPPDISANVIMEMEKPGFESYDQIKKYALKLVKVLQNQKRHRGAVNLVDAYGGVEYEDSQLEEEDVSMSTRRRASRRSWHSTWRPAPRQPRLTRSSPRSLSDVGLLEAHHLEDDQKVQVDSLRGLPVPPRGHLRVTELTCNV